MQGGVTENDCVESHPQYDELKGAHVCVLRCAYPKDDLHPSDEHFIGWRTKVEDVDRRGGHVFLYGHWFKLNDKAIRPVRQEESRLPEEENPPVIPSAVSAAAAVVADEGEEIEPEGGHADEEAEPDMEDAAQSSADEAVSEAGPSGLLSI